MFTAKTLINLLLIILLILIALIFSAYMSNKSVNELIGSKTSILKSGGMDDFTPERLYNYLSEYVDEIGTSKYIEDYLTTLHDIKSYDIDYETRTNQYIKHKKFYQLLKNLMSTGDYDNKYDFIFSNGIKYIWFLPPELRAPLLGAEKLKYKTFDRYAIKNNMQQLIYPQSVSGNEETRLVNKLEALSRLYPKYKPEVVKELMSRIKERSGGKDKKSKSAAKSSDKGSKSAKDASKKSPGAKAKSSSSSSKTSDKAIPNIKLSSDMLSPDILGFDAVIYQIARKVKDGLSAVQQRTISDQLGNINLVSMQFEDPLAVRRFINRIKPDIRTIESMYGPSKTSLMSDILASERELAEARWAREKAERAREKAEAEKRLLASRLPPEPYYTPELSSYIDSTSPSAPPLETPSTEPHAYYATRADPYSARPPSVSPEYSEEDLPPSYEEAVKLGGKDHYKRRYEYGSVNLADLSKWQKPVKAN